MDGLIDSHYFTLPTQGNIYSLARLNSITGAEKLLVATLKKKVFCFECISDEDNVLSPEVKEVSFTYIPSGAEIISIDAFNKSTIHDDFVVGITIIKPKNDSETEKYLNIYSEPELDEDNVINLDSLANNCFMLELDFVPYILHHSSLPPPRTEIVWFLSGSDSKIHLYIEDVSNHTYHEIDIAEYFFELASPSAIVLWMDIKYIHQDTKRLSVMGCEDWTVKISLVDVQNNSLLSVYNYECDGPISRVSFFTFGNNVETASQDSAGAEDNQNEEIHLLVTATLNQSVVFMNVSSSGIREQHFLPYKDSYDAILCSICADIDFDGTPEIILGTYSQELVLYKYNGFSWETKSSRGISNPVLGMEYLDLSQDGINEFLVMTLRGIHVFQHDPKIVLKRLKETLDFEALLSSESVSS